ncbi:MAG: hypothetical protein EOO85_25200, partial [Pedobacter sp.]
MSTNHNIVDQTLHGYADGHGLLAGSIELPIEIRRTLQIMSDISGSTVSEGFDSYLTGYPIEGTNLFVLGKTWIANELPRPGCVWTHSLIIDLQNYSELNSAYDLLNCFKRPNANETFDSYNLRLTIERKCRNEIEDLPSGPINSILSSLYDSV